MSQPNPGWYPQQQPYQQAPYGQQPYGPPPGYPQGGYGAPPPGYGPFGPPRQASPVMAFVSAAFFLPAIAFTYIVAIMTWDGITPDNVDAAVSVLGVAFSDDLTGNVDFAITLSMIYPSVTLLFVALEFARVGFVRWVLAALAGIAVGYYVYAIIDLASTDGGGDYVGLPILALLLWLVPLVIAVLPITGRAMRRRVGAPPMAQGHWY
ncbi:hypothetical protein [Prauserella muralis]|uniref:Uncharacterized protein n=1 Tax=Prauserella muralis TaxID=588067 RepID=A0A2V4B7Y4_9PSEU|nr:hypothetical protein [Prauserella muralis]PXY31454.1 hypothetical protein BAY60_03475 [Prauserella muralis]TWE14207.1 hypothetical protein FHX69_6345 [Prauserella muralis]